MEFSRSARPRRPGATASRRARRLVRSLLTAAVSAGLIASLATPASAAAPAPVSKSARTPAKLTVPPRVVDKLPHSLDAATGRVAVFIRLNRVSAVDAYSAKLASGPVAAAGAAKAARSAANSTATAVMTALKTKDRSARQLYRTTNAVPGVAVVADAGKVRELAARADVVSISRLVPKKLDNAHSAVLTRVLNTWQTTGLTGQGIRVGIIDSGVDYTHADFGGPGTVAAYDAIDPAAPTTAFPTAKVVGGTDLAGSNYDAGSDDPAQYTPNPDPNPLDCDGHGSHVAGIAAGFGVNADGSTFRGNYRNLTASKLAAMRVGPGMAPKALIYAIKVFGCPDGASAGSTFLVAPGIDWALDPNGDGNFKDHLNLVNISIGADYSSPDDPDAMFIAKAVAHNMLVVTSAGNAGDLYDVGGDAPAALTVASSQDSFNLLDAVEVKAPANVAGTRPGQVSVAFDYIGYDQTRPVVKMTDATNLDGCKPFSAADKAKVKGKFVWLEWDDNDATRACGSAGRSGNAAAAGADGVILTSTLEQFSAGITGSPDIPVFQLTGSGTAALRPALNAGTLVIRIAGSLVLSFPINDPSLTDRISDFSSRGTRTPGVKPDVSAPGETIISAGKGTGNLAKNLSGTSMASPHVAGIAALVRQAHPSWSAAEVKATIMSTAIRDLFSKPDKTKPIYGPNREGTGRVDALAATRTKVFAAVSDQPTTVSVGFGVIEVKASRMTLSKTITVTNKGSRPATYGVSYRAITSMPGVAYTLDRSRVTVPARGRAKIKVTIHLDRNALRKRIDPTVNPIDPTFGVPRDVVADASGRVELRPIRGATVPLRVAVYAAPKPVAAITVPSQVKTDSTGRGFLQLGGRGLDQGTGSQAYVSLYSVFELGVTSPQLKSCKANQTSNCAINQTAKGGDIRYVGAASNVRAAVASGRPEDAMVQFGFAMWSNWYNLGSNTIPFVDIDVDGDGTPDFETFVTRLEATDLLLVETVDLNSGDVVDLELANNITSDVDANVFDTNVISLPVFLSSLGIDPTKEASHRITYQAGVAGFYTAPDDSLIDLTDVASYDPLKPGLSASGLPGDEGLLFVAAPGTGLFIHRDAASLKQDPYSQLLVLDFHNPSGARAKLVKVS